MPDSLSRHSIDSDTHGGGAKRDRNPSEYSHREAQPLKYLEQKCPRHGVKGVRKIKLDQNSWFFPCVDFPGKLSHEQEIVMQVPAFNERRLVLADKGLHFWAQAIRDELGEEFCETVD
jgi:hypothetical protein